MQINYLLDCIIDIQNDPYIIRLLCRCVAVPAYEARHTQIYAPTLASKKEFGLYPALILRLSDSK